MADEKQLPSMGPTMAPPPAPPKTAAPMFFIGGDDRPNDTRIVAISLGIRGEMKVADREFSSPLCLHELVVMRHFYESKAGSGSIRATTGWPPGLKRERRLTHSDLVAEVKRMRETYVVPKPNGQVIKSFELFFGAEPAEQLKRLHAVLRDQNEAWNLLLAKAMARLPSDTADLHEEIRRSMACDLVTERELEQVALLADPGRAGLETVMLDEIKPSALAATPVLPVASTVSLDDVRAKAEAEADAEIDPPTRGELARAALATAGFDADRALGVAALVDQYGDGIKDADLLTACGSKAKVEQAKAVIAKLPKV